MTDHAPPGDDRPGILAPPPLIYLSALATGLLVEWWVPAARLPEAVPRHAGWLFAAAGTCLLVWAVVVMRRARTAIDPYKPSTAVVEDGPYRYSRNPIYVADALLYVGLALLLRSLVGLLLLPVALLVMEFGVVRREERYLEKKFGGAYLKYKSRVRRWL